MPQLRLGRPQTHFGLPHGQFQIGGVELSQHIAGLDPISHLNGQLIDEAAQLERQVGLALGQHLARRAHRGRNIAPRHIYRLPTRLLRGLRALLELLVAIPTGSSQAGDNDKDDQTSTHVYSCRPGG